MRPRSVAVIGANRAEGTIGHQIVRNLIDHGFTGPVYPVNPNAARVAGLRAYASVREVPRPVELAVVAVRATAVADAVADCAAAGVGAIVVITADHDDNAGHVLPAPQLLSFVQSHGIRLVGPTSMGVLSVGPDSTLDVTFASLHPRPGTVAMSSQSGPLGLALLEIANRTGMGFSAFVSIGDAVDVSGIDLLEWWEDDPGTAAVLLQADRFGNPRDFVRIARRVSARKPIVAVASGDAATAALLGQAGIIHTANFDEMFDTALVLAHQPVPRGNRIAIVTNARDTGLLASRACAGNGLRPARVAGTPPQSPDPIIDLGHAATPQDYQRTLRLALRDPAVDAVLAIFIPPLVRDALDVGAAILGAARESRDTTMVASFMSESGVPEPLRAADVAVPSFTFPERAIAALGRAAAYGAWRRAAAGVVSYPSDMRRPDARRLVTAAGEGPLSDAEVATLFDCYGIPIAAEGPADADQAPAATPAAPAAPTAPAAPATPAPELDAVLGMRLDPLVGPVLRFALAGLPRDVFGDIALAVTPLTDRDAHRLVTSLRALPMLTGTAGGPAYDIGAVEDILLRLSALVDDHERVTEVDIPRLRIGLEGRGAVAAAPAVRLGPSPVTTPDRE